LVYCAIAIDIVTWSPWSEMFSLGGVSGRIFFIALACINVLMVCPLGIKNYSAMLKIKT
jgi:hypothetical protein